MTEEDQEVALDGAVADDESDNNALPVLRHSKTDPQGTELLAAYISLYALNISFPLSVIQLCALTTL